MSLKRFLLAIGAAILMDFICIGFNLDPFLSGWFSCTAFFAVTNWNRTESNN